MKLKLSLFAVLFAVLLIASSAVVHASTLQSTVTQEQANQASIDNLNRPYPTNSATSFTTVRNYYENSVLDYYGANLTQAERDAIKSNWTRQDIHNQEVAKETNGAVYQFSPSATSSALSGTSSPLDSLSGCYLSYVDPGHVSSYEPYGWIQNPSSMVGPQDWQYAELFTDGWNGDWNHKMGGEAFAAGWMQTSFGGDIELNCRAGINTGSQPPWENIVMVYVSNDINTTFLSWTYVGIISVMAPWSFNYYVGNIGGEWNCISIMCWTPYPPYPPGAPYPDYYNDVLVDSVFASYSWNCQLNIASANGGTTYPTSQCYADYGNQIAVTATAYANYAFDYWTLDGIVHTENPITVTMTRSQHFLEPHFSYVGSLVPLYVYSFNQHHNQGYVPLMIDGQVVGTTDTGIPYYVTIGYHSISVPEYVGSSVFQCFAHDGVVDYTNPDTLYFSSPESVVAWYLTY